MHAQPITRIGAVLDALVPLCEGIDGALQVIDGPYVGELNADVLVLGVPDGNTPGYKTTVTRQEGFVARHREDWRVHVMLSLTTGDDNVRVLRNRAVTLMGRLDTALRDVGDTDAWDRAALSGDMDWLPLLGPNGAAMAVFFDITGAALL